MDDLRIDPNSLALIRKILREHIPGYEVWAFGSRVHGENLKPFSDLDLVVMTEHPLTALTMVELKDAFRESELSFKVDVLDWSRTNERFRKIIRDNHCRIDPKPSD